MLLAFSYCWDVINNVSQIGRADIFIVETLFCECLLICIILWTRLSIIRASMFPHMHTTGSERLLVSSSHESFARNCGK